MWEVAALVEVLERKGLLIRQELYDTIHELRQRHPEATTLERNSLVPPELPVLQRLGSAARL